MDGLDDEPGDSSDDSSEKLVIAADSSHTSDSCPEKSPARKRGRPKKSESSSPTSPPAATTTAAKKSKLMAVLNKASAAAGQGVKAGEEEEDTATVPTVVKDTLTGKYWADRAEQTAGGRVRTRSRSGHSMPPPPPSRPNVRQMVKKQREEKKMVVSEKDEEEKDQQESVLGGIMVAQKSTLQKESCVVNSDAMSQGMEDCYKEHHGKEDPVKEEELKPPAPPSPTKKLNEMSKKQREKKRLFSDTDEEEKGQQESVLGDIMVAQKSTLQRESCVINSDAMSQGTEDHSKEHLRAVGPVKAEELKPPLPPSPNKKLNDLLKKQREEKKKRVLEKDEEEKKPQESVLGNIMVAQKSMLQKESRVVNSDAMLQDMEGRYEEYHGEDLRKAADPVKADELKPPSGNFSYRLWNLRRKGSSSGGGGDPVKVLVRAKTHAIVSNKKNDKEYRRSHQTFTLSSRLGELMSLEFPGKQGCTLGKYAINGQNGGLFLHSCLKALSQRNKNGQSGGRGQAKIDMHVQGYSSGQGRSLVDMKL